MLEYKSPSATESPEVECIIVESVDPEGPFGAKEASEGSLAATIPAIANAIYDAVGVRLREAPFTPERVLAAIKAKHSEKKALDITRGDDPWRRQRSASMVDRCGSKAKGRSGMRMIRRGERATRNPRAGDD